MPDTPQCPPVSEGLIKHLEGVFPNRLPETDTPSFKLGEMVGAVRVINHLKKVLREQLAKDSIQDVHLSPKHTK